MWIELLGYGALVLEMNLPHADAEACACYHPHDECESCGCPLLAAALLEVDPPRRKL